MGKKLTRPDISSLPLDDQFAILLHKKIMLKRGSAKRQAKKYYIDQYKKTGVIPKPLILAAQGIMEGRRCSGRPRSLDSQVKKRFIEMVKASSDPDDSRFLFITRNARKVTSYHKWLQEDFQQKISLSALRRCVKKEKLQFYLKKPDFDDDQLPDTYFNPQAVFDLIQVDGCFFHYLKIRDDQGNWRKPLVMEYYDTGSRYMFELEAYFSESNENSVDLFSRFLLSTDFADKKIRIRPDNAKGFVNLKRPIKELNLKYSMPDRFYLAPDFAGVNAPKHKVHLESSHRSLHDFEISIIRRFEDKIIKTEPGFIFKNKKPQKITVTYLDIDMRQLRQSKMIETYRRQHNEGSHRFLVKGKVLSWIPKEKFQQYMQSVPTIEFEAKHVQGFMKYGFVKKKATVSKKGHITFNNQTYVVVEKEKFSRQTSTKVVVSEYDAKLLIFENEADGIYLADALCQGPSKKPKFNKNKDRIKLSEIDRIIFFLQEKNMSVHIKTLIKCYRKGLSFKMAKQIYDKNRSKYHQYNRLPESKKQIARFNAFIIDCQRYQRKDHNTAYAQLQAE
jgi:hypothetical protein